MRAGRAHTRRSGERFHCAHERASASRLLFIILPSPPEVSFGILPLFFFLKNLGLRSRLPISMALFDRRLTEGYRLFGLAVGGLHAVRPSQVRSCGVASGHITSYNNVASHQVMLGRNRSSRAVSCRAVSCQFFNTLLREPIILRLFCTLFAIKPPQCAADRV